jgi:hypothetical protein
MERIDLNLAEIEIYSVCSEFSKELIRRLGQMEDSTQALSSHILCVFIFVVN